MVELLPGDGTDCGIVGTEHLSCKINSITVLQKPTERRTIPYGLVARILGSHPRGSGSIPGTENMNQVLIFSISIM